MIALMYHDFEDVSQPSEKRGTDAYYYTLSAESFRQQMDLVASLELSVLTLSDYSRLQDNSTDLSRAVLLTFDDAHESVERVALSIMRSHGFSGTIFAIAGFVDKEAYSLSSEQLRAFRAEGWENGNHGMTHVELTEIDDERLQQELVDSKDVLQNKLGERIDKFSIPQGPYNRRVRQAAIAAGYSHVMCSTPGINGSRADRFSLKRMSMTRAVDLETFRKILTLDAGFFRREWARRSAFATAQKLLGARRYRALRSILLKKH